MTRLRAIFAAAAALLCLACGQAQAQNWPNRPVKIIAPFAAGGAADTLGRIIADHLSTAFHQQFFVENRGGAGGMVGAAAGAAAEPDGYTLVVSSIASNVISPVFNANAGYDGLRDFTHIAYLGGPPVVMIVHPSLGVSTYKDFVALARQNKEPMSFISPGTRLARISGRGISGAAGGLQGQPHPVQRRGSRAHRPGGRARQARHHDLLIRRRAGARRQGAGARGLDRKAHPERPGHPDVPRSGPGPGGGDVVRAVGTGAAAERHRAAAQPRDAQGHAAARGAEAARARRHRIQADVAGRIHQVRRGETARWAPLAKSLAASHPQ